MALRNLLRKIVLPGQSDVSGRSTTNTFNPRNRNTALARPTHREHTRDIVTTRIANDARQLLQDLFKHDSDVSAAVNAWLTVADTEPLFFVRTMDGQPDRRGQLILQRLLHNLQYRTDYTTGFEMRPNILSIAEQMRYMILLRGAVGCEAIFDEFLQPSEIRLIDMGNVDFFEPEPGQYKPVQLAEGEREGISLDVPNFFISYFRRDPLTPHPTSPFVSSINTVAARQRVINDLYRLMQNGYQRITIKVVEEVLRKNAPANVRGDDEELHLWMSGQLQSISDTYAGMRPDDIYVHTDSQEPSILNPGGPKDSMNIENIVEVLNAMNQSALKTMATVIGRGESGVNTASVEARIFAMNAEELNQPVAEALSKIFTLALRLQGSKTYCECRFTPVELRPELELEPQKVVRQKRLLELLSLGLISDDEFHLQMFNRYRPDAIPELSGTGFMGKSDTANVNTDDITPNTDPLNRSITPDGSTNPEEDNRVQ